MIPVVLVDVGVFQEYIIDNIKNLILFGNTNIHVITEPEFFDKFIGLNVTLIDQNTLKDKYDYSIHSKEDYKFRGGFSIHPSRRLFLIYEWMVLNDIQNCIHIENDCPTYINFDKVFSEYDSNKMWIPMSCHKWAVPSLLYINQDVYKKFIDEYIPDPSGGDMKNLARAFHQNPNIKALPIYYEQLPNVPEFYSQHFNGILFDAAAMGQYLGGVDPRNAKEDPRFKNKDDTRGFINESCVIKTYHHHNFFWIKIDGLYVPHLEKNGRLIPIANLHVHCKEVKNFMADDPKECGLIKKLDVL